MEWWAFNTLQNYNNAIFRWNINVSDCELEFSIYLPKRMESRDEDTRGQLTCRVFPVDGTIFYIAIGDVVHGLLACYTSLWSITTSMVGIVKYIWYSFS